METKEVFEKSSNYGNEIKRLRKEMEEYAKKCTDLWDKCNHEIVFKYNDSHPRKMPINGYYFCPACGRTIECIYDTELKVSPFKKSRIIPLSNLSLYATKELYSDIRKEVYFNYDFYYNPETNIEDMQNKMEHLLKKYHDPYTSIEKVLRRTKKDK